MNEPNQKAAPTELLPCPFCGEQPSTGSHGQDDEGYYFVECSTCRRAKDMEAERFIGCHGENLADAITLWNRRAPAPAALEGASQAREVRMLTDEEAYQAAAQHSVMQHGWAAIQRKCAEVWGLTIGEAVPAREVPQGFKLLKDTTLEERSFDERHSDGAQYMTVCMNCLRSFLGRKGRVTCRACAAAPSDAQGEPT